MYKEGFASLSSGLKAFYRAWIPEEVVRGVVIGVHGFAEHSGRYSHVGEAFAKHGYAFYMHDLRGHGRTAQGSDAGYIDRFSEFLDDLDSFIDYVSLDSGSSNLALLGHSMGGLIVLHYLAEKKEKRVKAAVVTGAATLIEYPVLQRTLLSLVAFFKPKARVDLPIKPELLSSDTSVGEKYMSDNLVLKKPSLRLIYELYKASKSIWRKIGEIETPILVIHGGDDKIIPPQGSIKLYRELRVKDKELKVYEGMRHEVLNEHDWMSVVEYIVKWLNAHMAL
ncbi:MAG: lysophospholipase [Desulfurococcus sp.]|nr:lysophospholipase [Desulfurococcus sp.]